MFIELATWLGYFHPDWSLWFYRDQQNHEADFLVQGPFEHVRVMDAKWAEMPKRESFEPLKQIAELIVRARGIKKVEVAIVSRTDSSTRLGDDWVLASGLDLWKYLEWPEWPE